MSDQLLYTFSTKSKAQGNADMLEILGSKGAHLAEMCNIGINVPPGFTLSTKLCVDYIKNGKLADNLMEELKKGISFLEKETSKSFGGESPLILSVRSGASASMPGMMETILNIGINDQTLPLLANSIKDQENGMKFAIDSYLRLIKMYANAVFEVETKHFDTLIEKTPIFFELSIAALENLLQLSKDTFLKHCKTPFPQDPFEQLIGAIKAVCNSWNSARAQKYRNLNHIDHSLGTAVNIQTMVFGNIDNNSASGVLFTRNPANGKKEAYGEFLYCSQGEDLVSGSKTPFPLEDIIKIMPECGLIILKQIKDTAHTLEKHYKDIQDIEFTIESGNLWILQTRKGKCNPLAMVKISHDLAAEGIISKDEALLKLETDKLQMLLHPQMDCSQAYDSIAKGLPASPGAACGMIAFDIETAEKMSLTNNVLLVRDDTNPKDIAGIASSVGILTTRGGMTSHAAVVARGMGKPCVTGASSLILDYENKKLITEDQKLTFKEGDILTINGDTGEVIRGEVTLIEPTLPPELNTMIEWAKERKKIGVFANAETKNDIETALKHGAEGIGLCRTEHMFFEEKRLKAMRKMILTEKEEVLSAILEELFSYQKQDFASFFRLMKGKPFVIRLLDPPLHEFIPKETSELKELALELGTSLEEIKVRVESLSETNPMLGHRGIRLGVTHPQIYLMQARAIFEAAFEEKALGLEIMVPFVFLESELKLMIEKIKECYVQVASKYKSNIEYKIGTMIELPRAALIANKLAAMVDFFSFGSNDLTQTTLGLSRDDIGKFLNTYFEKQLINADPFISLDIEGVGELINIASQKGRSVNPLITLGVCGEHGGDPKSIEFFNKIGIDYVSCSPYRIPIAIIAAAISVIKNS